ncbi:adenylylsulfate kinase [Campylobacter sp. RM5004]|uniref:adenylyl-sulfate kinase n=1 Tax=Campylobacter sp. RM5004 TaxID=1660078 RepID=UPI001EFABD79|nr:adenylyl-sulfate kinase [Campylobacter sp. RM5004]ULO01699.1 adenylylsulfate kinase [Campylobacter sp. RM5004]
MNNITWHNQSITKEQRAMIKNQNPCIVWLTGLSGSGKSTLANALEVKLHELGYHTYLLDGDNIRYGLNSDLGFDEKSRVENIRRIAHLCKLFLDSGLIVISAFISPFKEEREFARNLVNKNEFIEVYINTPLEICEQRDPKGLYKKARNGEITNFTGITSPYESPDKAEITIYVDELEKNVAKIIYYLQNNILRK